MIRHATQAQLLAWVKLLYMRWTLQLLWVGESREECFLLFAAAKGWGDGLPNNVLEIFVELFYAMLNVRNIDCWSFSTCKDVFHAYILYQIQTGFGNSVVTGIEWSYIVWKALWRAFVVPLLLDSRFWLVFVMDIPIICSVCFNRNEQYVYKRRISC